MEKTTRRAMKRWSGKHPSTLVVRLTLTVGQTMPKTMLNSVLL